MLGMNIATTYHHHHTRNRQHHHHQCRPSVSHTINSISIQFRKQIIMYTVQRISSPATALYIQKCSC